MFQNEIYYIYIFIIIAISAIAVFFYIYRRKFNANLPQIFRDHIFPLVSPIFKNVLIWSDVNGKIILANDMAREILKIPKQNFVGYPLDAILSNEDIKKIRLSFPGQIINFQTELTVRGGEKIITEIMAMGIKILDAHWGYLISADSHMQEIIAIENELSAQTELSDRYTRQLQKLENIIRDIFNKPKQNRIEILSDVTVALYDFFDAYLTICWQNESEENFRLIAQKGVIKSDIEAIRGQLLPKNEIARLIAEKRTIIVETAALSGPFKILLEGENVFALVLVPYFDQKNKISGILEFYLQSKSEFEVNKKIFSTLSVLLTILYILFDIKISSGEEMEEIKTKCNKSINELTIKLSICEKNLKELQDFQQVTIGRELKMVELKDYIRQLENQLKKH